MIGCEDPEEVRALQAARDRRVAHSRTCTMSRHAPCLSWSNRDTWVSRRYCAQYTSAEWHRQLGGMQADATVDRLVYGPVRIDPGDINVRKLPVGQAPTIRKCEMSTTQAT